MLETWRSSAWLHVENGPEAKGDIEFAVWARGLNEAEFNARCKAAEYSFERDQIKAIMEQLEKNNYFIHCSKEIADPMEELYKKLADRLVEIDKLWNEQYQLWKVANENLKQGYDKIMNDRLK